MNYSAEITEFSNFPPNFKSYSNGNFYNSRRNIFLSFEVRAKIFQLEHLSFSENFEFSVNISM
jgi:hypothetical protein